MSTAPEDILDTAQAVTQSGIQERQSSHRYAEAGRGNHVVDDNSGSAGLVLAIGKVYMAAARDRFRDFRTHVNRHTPDEPIPDEPAACWPEMPLYRPQPEPQWHRVKEQRRIRT